MNFMIKNFCSTDLRNIKLKKPCGCIGTRICMKCVEVEENSNFNYNQQLDSGGFRCSYAFVEPPEEFLNSINFPICDSSDEEAPSSCKVINVLEPYPEIDGYKFPYFELLRPVILDEEIITTDEEAHEDVQKITKKKEVKRNHTKKERRETRVKTYKTDKHAKSHHRESKRRRERHSSYSSNYDSSNSNDHDLSIHGDDEFANNLKDYIKVRRRGQVKKSKPKGKTLSDCFQSGSPLKTVTHEEVESVQSTAENFSEIENEKACSAAQKGGKHDEVLTEETSENSSQSITFKEEERATCELPPSLDNRKDPSPAIETGMKAIKLIENYSSHSDEENENDGKSSYDNQDERKRSRKRSPDRGRDTDYKRSRYSIEEDRSDYHEEGYSNFDEYGENQTYYCKYCLKTMNSWLTWESHVLGKKHIKAKKLAHPERMASESVPQLNADVSRRLRIKAAPLGYERVSCSQPSRIQKLVEDLIREGRMLIGLEHVTELIGPQNDFSYYCCLCDAICMANSIIGHLLSFRHKLSFVKIRNHQLYDKVNFEKKSTAEPKVNAFFQQAREPPGIIKVVKDIPMRHNDLDLPEPRSSLPRYFSDTASMISEYSMADTIDPEVRQVEPVTTKGDYFCKVCNSHMNSENMWISHVNGKRHLKNVNKAPGEAPSKVKFVKSNAPARLLDVIADWESYEENRTEIICGLDYICERHLENGHELYNCYLCHSNCTPREIIDHLISLKHMRKYIEKEDPAAAENLTKLTTNMSNYGIKSLHLEACVNLVKERGVGKIEVLVPK